MANEVEILNQMINYGLAGVVIYLLFRIVFDDLQIIKSELRDINKRLERLEDLLKEVVRSERGGKGG